MKHWAQFPPVHVTMAALVKALSGSKETGTAASKPMPTVAELQAAVRDAGRKL